MKCNYLKLTLAAIAAVCVAAGAVAANFVWIGQGLDDDWDTRDNFYYADNETEVYEYPDDPQDNADFTWKAFGGAWDCNLIGESIGEMTIKGSVDFDTAGGTVTMEVTKLKIEPTSGDVEVTVNGAAVITVQ